MSGPVSGSFPFYIPRMRPAGIAARDLTAGLLFLAERDGGLRLRNASERAAYGDLIDGLAANVLHFVGRGHDGISLSLWGNGARRLRRAVGCLAAAGLVAVNPGGRYRGFDAYGRRCWKFAASTVEPSPKFSEGVALHGVAEEGYRVTGLGRVVLRAPRDIGGAPLQFAETANTRQWVEELERINAMLASAKITWTGPDSVEQVPGQFVAVDASRVACDRIFNGDFNHGGRLAGAFWLSVPKPLRRMHLRMDGRALVQLDFNSMHPRLAYASVGAAVPEGDLYDVCTRVGRDTVKRLFSAALCKGTAVRRWPQGFGRQCVPVVEVMAAINAKHPAISHLFGTGAGLRLQRTESDILIAALLDLAAQGIPALPLHDCLAVAQGHEHAARDALLRAAEARTGAAFIITED